MHGDVFLMDKIDAILSYGMQYYQRVCSVKKSYRSEFMFISSISQTFSHKTNLHCVYLLISVFDIINLRVDSNVDIQDK